MGSLVIICSTLIGISSSVGAQTFDDLARGFRQRKSPACVMYAHVIAVAEHDPVLFAKNIHKVYNGWTITFFDNRRVYVTRDELTTSLTYGYSADEPDNLMTVYMIGLSKRCGGFSQEKGEITYGKLDFRIFLSGNKWTLYDNEQKTGYKLTDGFTRLEEEVSLNGNVIVPCTIGFGILDEKTIPRQIEEVKKRKLIGGHDYEVSAYDAKNKMVLLRNPWKPRDILPIPIDLLKKIPCGIDFMECS